MTPAQYHEQGFARFEGAIDRAAAAEALAWIVDNRMRDELSGTRDPLNRHNRHPIKLRRLWEADYPFWQHFIATSGVLALARRLIGDDFLLIRSAAFLKYPATESFVGWHCDADLWGHACDAGLTAWIPLTAVPPHSGCLQFLPGSHVAPHGKLVWDLRHPFHKIMEVDGMGQAVAVPAEVGDCIVMERRAVHASGPNRSGHERIGLVLAFARCSRAAINEPALVFDASARSEKIFPT